VAKTKAIDKKAKAMDLQDKIAKFGVNVKALPLLLNTTPLYTW